MAKTNTTAKALAKSKVTSTKKTAGETEVTMCRRRGDRRSATSKDAAEDPAVDSKVAAKKKTAKAAADEPIKEEASGVAPPERRKVPRRRQIDPTTCERDYTGEEIEFMHALDAYKRSSGRMFPTCSEILEVVRGLGYYKLSEEQCEQFFGSQEDCGDGDVATATALENSEV